MEREFVALCPVCKEKLLETRLRCNNCELELNGDFPLGKFNYLSSDEIEFVESFLKHQGSLKDVQKEKGISYPATQKKFNDILDKLKLTAINK